MLIDGWQIKSLGISWVISTHYLGTKDFCVKFHGTPSSNFFFTLDQSVGPKDEQTDHTTSTAKNVKYWTKIQNTGCPQVQYNNTSVIITLRKAWWSYGWALTCTAHPSKRSSSRLSSSTAASEETEITVIIIIIIIIFTPHRHPPYHYHLNAFQIAEIWTRI